MAHPKYLAEIKQQALDLLAAGKSSVEISRLLHIPATTICTWAYSKPTTKKIPEAEVAKLVLDYQSGLSLSALENQTGFNRKAISKVLKDCGVDIASYGKRIQSVKHNPFADLSNPEVNYWLGLLAADGHVLDEGVVKLSSIDIDILEKFATFTGCGKPVYGQGRVWTCGFMNKEVAEYLSILGITPRKSLTLDMQIPLTTDFVRGYWDGNGNQDQASICTGSLLFANQLVDFLKSFDIETKTRIRKASTYKYKNEDRPTAENYQVYTVGKESRSDFFNLIFYNDDLISIDRKKIKFIYC